MRKKVLKVAFTWPTLMAFALVTLVLVAKFWPEVLENVVSALERLFRAGGEAVPDFPTIPIGS